MMLSNLPTIQPFQLVTFMITVSPFSLRDSRVSKMPPQPRNARCSWGERKMKDYRQSPSFWPNALLSQRITLSPYRVSPFSRGVIFTSSRISLTLLSLRENGDYSNSNYMQFEIANLEWEETGSSKLWQRFLGLFNTRDREEIFNNYSSSPNGLWVNSPWGPWE